MGLIAYLDWCGRTNEYTTFRRRKHIPRIPCSSSSSGSSSSGSGSCSIAGQRQVLSRSLHCWPRCRHLIILVVFAATIAFRGRTSASSNPMELNGGSCLAMAGKGCVALAVDRRFGLEGQLVSTDAKRVLKVSQYHEQNSSTCRTAYVRGLEAPVLSGIT